MHQALKHFDALPRSFQVLLVLFLLVPIWSTMVVGSPLATALDGRAAGWFALVAYWIGPFALSLALARRSHLVVFAFMAECVAMLAHTLSTDVADSAAYTVARGLMIACVAGLGLAFLSRDVAIPFIAGGKRGFRGATRLRSNSSLRLTTASGKEIAAEMEDCSLAGMAFAAAATDDMPHLARGDRISLEVKTERGRHVVDGRIEWCARDDLFLRVGVSTGDVETMAAVIDGVTLRAVSVHRRSLMKLATKASHSRTAFATWLLAFAGTIGVPACGTDSSFSQGKTASATMTKDKDKDKDKDTKSAGKKGPKREDDDENRDAKDATNASIDSNQDDGTDYPGLSPVDDTCAQNGSDRTGKVQFPPKKALPQTVPPDCRDGIEFNRYRGIIVLNNVNAAEVGLTPLEVDIATYHAPDHIRILAHKADGNVVPILDTCRLQTADYSDPTSAEVERPPEDSIREFRVTIPANTVRVDIDTTDAKSPMYMRVVGLCQLLPRASGGTDSPMFHKVGILDRSGATVDEIWLKTH